LLRSLLKNDPAGVHRKSDLSPSDRLSSLLFKRSILGNPNGLGHR
jgi:hypothetical protein